jgi:hypothetical protein
MLLFYGKNILNDDFKENCHFFAEKRPKAPKIAIMCNNNPWKYFQFNRCADIRDIGN